MSQQRWEADLDEDLQDVDLNLAIGNYGQNGMYDEGERSYISRTNEREQGSVQTSGTQDRRSDAGRCAATDGTAGCICPNSRRCETGEWSRCVNRLVGH